MYFLVQYLPIEVQKITHSNTWDKPILAPVPTTVATSPPSQCLLCAEISIIRKSFVNFCDQPAAGFVRAMSWAVFIGGAFLQLGPACPITLHQFQILFANRFWDC